MLTPEEIYAAAAADHEAAKKVAAEQYRANSKRNISEHELFTRALLKLWDARIERGELPPYIASSREVA